MKIDRNESTTKLPVVIYGLIVLAILTRLLPHPINITSVGALSLFAGAFLPIRIAWMVPVFTLLISDAVTGFYSPVVMIFVYLGFASGTLIGRFLLMQKRSIPRLGSGAVLGACIFFVLSNFGMWLSGAYPYTMDGLIVCYVNAIPYFRHTLVGDIFYTFLLFGSYELIRLTLVRLHYAR